MTAALFVISFLIAGIGFVFALQQMQSTNTAVRERIDAFRERREQRKKQPPPKQEYYTKKRPRATDEQDWD